MNFVVFGTFCTKFYDTTFYLTTYVFRFFGGFFGRRYWFSLVVDFGGFFGRRFCRGFGCRFWSSNLRKDELNYSPFLYFETSDLLILIV